MSDTPLDSTLIASCLRRRCPALPAEVVARVSAGWQTEIDEIIKRMLDITEKQHGFAVHLQLRDELCFELARLTTHLVELVVSKKLDEFSPEQLEGAASVSALSTDMGRERVENTAQIFAERIWSRFVDRWHERSKRLLGKENEPRALGPISFKRGQSPADLTRNNHFVPQFSNRPWGNRMGKLFVYSRGDDGGVVANNRAYTKWGAADFLYTRILERQLTAIERDATHAHRKLLAGYPLTGPDERDWVTFIISQFLRTPRYILRSMRHLAGVIGREDIDYKPTQDNLRRAYEQLFRNGDVYALYYRAITSRAWWVASASRGYGFIKSDEPVLMDGALANDASSLFLPLSPKKCFVAGPAFREGSYPLRVGEHDAASEQVAFVNRLSARNASETVIGALEMDCDALRSSLREYLATHPENKTQWEVPPYWQAR